MSSSSPLCLILFVTTSCIAGFAGIYGSSIIIVPIAAIFHPTNPYALSSADPVWALACEFVSGGIFTFFVADLLRSHPRTSLRGCAMASLLGQTLTGLSLYIASPNAGDHKTLGIVLYYLAHITFIGPSGVCGMTLGVTYIIKQFARLRMRKGLASGLVGPIVTLTTIPWMWSVYFYLKVVQVGTLASGVGRLDLFYYGWAAFLFVVQMVSSMYLSLNLPVAAKPKNSAQDCVSRTRLGQSDLMNGVGSRTFWSFFLVYLVNLAPGMGLKLLSGPIAQFSYGFDVWTQTVFTNVYLLLYALGRLISPMVCSGALQVRKFYLIYSLFSAAFLFATPGSVRGLPSTTWPSPLLFSFLIAVQGFFTGGFKGLQPTMLSSLWMWMSEDPVYSYYDPAPAFQVAIGMTNMALCFAGAIGPVTAYCSYVAPESPGALLSGTTTSEYGYEIWFYVAGVAQLFAGCLMFIPQLGVVKYTPKKL